MKKTIFLLFLTTFLISAHAYADEKLAKEYSINTFPTVDPGSEFDGRLNPFEPINRWLISQWNKSG